MMEEILVYLQDPRVIIPVLGVCALIIVFAILKRAVKLCAALILCGMLVASVKPVTTQVMANSGVSIAGTVLTITTESTQHIIDLSMGVTFDTQEQADGSYVITFTIPNQEPYEITVSESTATWIDFGARMINELEKVGEEAAPHIISMIKRY